MLSGSIVRVWGALESVLARYEGILSKSDRTMRVVRLDSGDSTSLIGARAALHCSDALQQALQTPPACAVSIAWTATVLRRCP